MQTNRIERIQSLFLGEKGINLNELRKRYVPI
jgi:hypothetical protein